jgi:rod shape determining protein RodA
MRINLDAKQKVYRHNTGFLNSIHLDGWLLLGILLLILASSLIIHSASNGNPVIVQNHLIRVGIAFSLLIFFAQIPPYLMRVYSPWLFTLVIIMLIAVLLFGETGKGAKRWLDIGFTKIQPSEIMKIVLPMAIAWLFAHSTLPPPRAKIITGLVIVLFTAGLIIVQPDLGTSILIAMSGLFVIFFAGLSWKWIVSAIAIVVSSLPILWNFYMHSYQKQRILTFLNPESDPLGSGYHIIQSKIAIGSGGFDGKGYMGSTQAHLEFLPESTTDFIFSVLAEEFGLVGVFLLLLTYTFVIGRGLYIASQAQDNFSRLIAASLTMTLFTYVFINIGMVSGLLPVVGLPLPLISYGGSSLVTIMISFGILMSIHTHKGLLKV